MTVLRVYGADFAVDRFVSETPFRPHAVFHRGERRSDGTPETESGAHVNVSLADWHDYDAQLRDIEAFVGAAGTILATVRERYGATTMEIDLPVNRRLGVQVHRYTLPAALATKLAAIGVDITLSVYPPDLSNVDPAEARITSHPEVSGGKPVIRGTRVLVRNVVGMLADGLAPWQIREHYPDISPEDIAAAVLYVEAKSDV